MKNFIIRRFIKDYKNTKDPKVRQSYGSVAGIIGIISNSILCVFKIGAGIIFNSIAILADGINNLTDASSSLFTLIGFKLSNRKADEKHPYGHGRTEYLTGLVISVFVLLIGILLLKNSIEKTINPEELDYSIISIVVLVVAIGAKLWQSSFNISIGKLINSNALIATGTDSRNDVISTSAVLLSTLLGKFCNINVDGPIGIVVSAFIIYSGIGLIKETISPILGQAPDQELVNEIAKLVLEGKYVLGIHDLIVHDYGPGRLFASCHAEVDCAIDIFVIHDEIDNIEKLIGDKLNVLMTIHMDPVNPRDEEIIKLKEIINTIVESVDGVESFHDVRVVPGPTHTNVVFDVVMEYDCKYSDDEIVEEIKQELKKIDVKYNAVITVDKKFV